MCRRCRFLCARHAPALRSESTMNPSLPNSHPGPSRLVEGMLTGSCALPRAKTSRSCTQTWIVLTHFHLLGAHVTDNFYDVVAVIEKFLTPVESDAVVALDDFNFYRLDKIDCGGGGVGIYVRNYISVNILAHSDPTYDNTPEYLILQLTSGLNKVLFSVVYRRPHAAYTLEFFERVASPPSYANVEEFASSPACEKESNALRHTANCASL